MSDKNTQEDTLEPTSAQLTLEEGAVVALAAFGEKVREILTVPGCARIGGRNANSEVGKRVKPTSKTEGYTLILMALRREI
jgi:hypothetical protein